MDQRPLRDGNEVQREVGGIHKTLHSWWKRSVVYPVGEIDDHVSTSPGNTIKSRTFWRIWERREKTKFTIEGVKNTEKWRASRGCQDASKWNCDQRRRQGKVDHNQQNCSAVESMYGHGCGNCTGQRFDRSSWPTA